MKNATSKRSSSNHVSNENFAPIKGPTKAMKLVDSSRPKRNTRSINRGVIA